MGGLCLGTHDTHRWGWWLKLWFVKLFKTAAAADACVCCKNTSACKKVMHATTINMRGGRGGIAPTLALLDSLHTEMFAWYVSEP